FDGKALNCSFVFHSPPQSIVFADRKSLHPARKCLSGRRSPPAKGGAEPASSPMQKNPKILTSNIKLGTNLVFIRLLDEDPLQHLSILILKFAERPPNEVGSFVLK